MKKLSTILTGIVLIFSSCAFSTKTTEKNNSVEDCTTSSIVNYKGNKMNKPGNYYQDKNDGDQAQSQRTLNVRGVPISASIRAKIINNCNKSHSIDTNTSDPKTYLATSIPVNYLSKPIKSKLLNTEQNQNPTFMLTLLIQNHTSKRNYLINTSTTAKSS